LILIMFDFVWPLEGMGVSVPPSTVLLNETEQNLCPGLMESVV